MINKFFDLAIAKKASDLHLSTDNPPMIRINGDLVKMSDKLLGRNFIINKIIKKILPHDKFEAFLQNLEMDYSISYKDDFRFRINCFFNNKGPAVTLRLIGSNIATLSDLNAPDILYNFCNLRQGLVIISGATGTGKSTTVAAMIDHINSNSKRHILMFEDPIEYVHRSKESLVNQREIGRDTKSFENSLKVTLRQDPDVVVIGEIRDLETMRLALTIAETGHLVLATLHTNSAYHVINRIIDVFPEDSKDFIRSMLSLSLKAIFCQRLVKTTDGSRCAAFEIMVANNAVRNLIRQDNIHNINSVIETSSKDGMITMNDYLQKLVQDKKITTEEMKKYYVDSK